MTDRSVHDTDAPDALNLVVLTWNIESIKKNIFFLKDTLEKEEASLAFLSEPQVFHADILPLMEYLKGDFCFFLNSDDLYDL